MKMNNTLAYGLACLHYLGENNGGRWNRMGEISKTQALPVAYCNKVLQALVRAGFVKSQKGRGYRLRKNLDEINVRDLMASVAFNGVSKIEKNKVSIKIYETLCGEVNHWLAGLTVRDVVEIMEKDGRREGEMYTG